MFSFRESRRFAKKRKKLLRNNKNLTKSFVKTLKQMRIDPKHPSLKTHKVIDIDGKKSFSSQINRDLRIIWDYSAKEIKMIDLIDIGGHEGSKKVYG